MRQRRSRGLPLPGGRGLALLWVAVVSLAAAQPLEAPDPYTLTGSHSFIAGYPATNPAGTVNAVIEIPAGTTAKWEVDERDGALRWEFRDGRPRVVRYLAYPGNYGMVPRTLLPEEQGGDGDPLDVIVLGSALERGTVVPVRVIGVLKLQDGGEWDDKLLAVREDTPFGELETLEQLDASFPGVTRILEIWFTSYKGPGEIESGGFASAADARDLLERAAAAYAAQEAKPR